MSENEFNQNIDAQNNEVAQGSGNIDGSQLEIDLNQEDVQITSEDQAENKSTGSIIAIIIIVVIIIIGGLYFWGEKINNKSEEVSSITAEEIMSQADDKTESLKQQGDSDLIADIEIDLGSTDLDNLDAEIKNIDAEFNF